MKNRICFAWVVLTIVFGQMLAFAGARDAEWRKVDEAVNKGLPKTAIEALDPIIKQATEDKAYGEAAKAIARKIVLEGTIQGNKPEEKITRIEAEIARAPAELKPVLITLQAHWYWHYFQQNRWRFMQRTATAEAPGKDFTTWDLTRLFSEIDRKFTEALAAEKVLKDMPISKLDDLLEKGTMPDSYRPTVYDFIANEALEFYTSGEQAAAKPQDAFEVPAEGEVFDPAEKFIGWKIQTEDTNSPAFKALQLYQNVLRFHQHDEDKSAFLDANIGRLVYGKSIAFGEDKNIRFKQAMQKVADANPKHELSSMALYQVAGVLREEGELVQARTTASRGAEAFPSSVGGQNCRGLIADIETKSAGILTEHIWNAPWPKITLQYRNIDRVYFRAIPYDWAKSLDKPYSQPGFVDWDERRAIIGRAPALEWSHKLPPTADFKQRVEETPVPTNLKPGYYIILASHNPNFGEKDNQVSMTGVWVSDLALVVRTGDGLISGFVLNANSGEPLNAATVKGWYMDNRNGKHVSIDPLKTDENGMFSFKSDQNRSYILLAEHGAHQVASGQQFYSYHWDRDYDRDQIMLFTDRAIYRPGQTIQFKGIYVHVGLKNDNYELVRDRDVLVRFVDANGKEVAQQHTRCNDFGSFSGSFTAPRDRLMGQMHIEANGAIGVVAFRVEEYKRPKFQVKLEAPKVAPRLNEKVSLTGHATAYTGAAVDAAQVKYRVVREIRWPWWWGWYGGWHRSAPRLNESQEIAHGSAKTEVDGTFKIEFVAKPDLSIPEKDEPTFVFRIYADVTDSAGETRSDDHTVNVGYTALQAMMKADSWLQNDKPVDLQITTQTLDGEPQVAEGVVKVYELKAPEKVQRPPLGTEFGPQAQVQRHVQRAFGAAQVEDIEPGQPDMSNPNNWPLGNVVAERRFTTDKDGKASMQFKLAAGAFRAVLETKDRFGKKVTGRLPIQVLQPEAKQFPIKIPNLVALRTNSWVPGEEFLALWGTGYEKGRAFVEVEHRSNIVKSYWTQIGQTQQRITLPITEDMRGGFTLHVTQVRENRGYLTSHRVDVPWSNKSLDVRWEHFTSKLQPGQKDTWTAVISAATGSAMIDSGTVKSGPRNKKTNQSLVASAAPAERVAAEMVATLYDESLDQFARHDWPNRFNFFRQDYSNFQRTFANQPAPFELVWTWQQGGGLAAITYRHFPYDLTQNFWGYGFPAKQRRAGGLMLEQKAVAQMETLDMAMPAAASAPAAIGGREFAKKAKGVDKEELGSSRMLNGKGAASEPGQGGEAPSDKGPDLSKVAARKNLNETAFFFPQLTSDSNGVVRMTFTMPEALTQWRLMGFAHDRNVRSGYIEAETVTAKDLMVQPNPPRFLREGDEIEITVKVSNQTDAQQRGKVRLTFNDGMTDKPADKLLQNNSPEQPFDIPGKQSRSFSWRIKVPDGLTVLTYKAVGATEKMSDGEEGFVPVLSRRIFVTESLPLPIRGPAEKKFDFKKLLESGKSDTLKHQSYVVQMVSNPSWYAVMALPYLMEYPYECSEQVFNRLYANALARHIAGSDPKIHRIFELWRGTPALDSPLEKNQDLKSVMLEETPWYRQAMAESQARKNVGLLFEDNRMNYELDRAMQKLRDQQCDNGAWPWFPGGPPSDYITLYITTGFGRLRHLGVQVDMQPALRSLNRLDGWIDEIYRDILRHSDPELNHLSPTIALYLYGRSFFLKDHAIAKNHREAVDYFLGQTRKFWLKLDNRQSQGHLAIALKRFNEFSETKDSTPTDIMKSIKERSVTDEELGMFWRELELSWWWFRAPIETQALMIEAFDEVMNDQQAVEDCKVWLLKQKQTQDWKTTKATADAVYALLLRGESQLASDALVEVSVGGIDITPKRGQPVVPAQAGEGKGTSAVEPGTGFYEKRFGPGEVKPSLGEITVKKVDKGVAWGSAHWQYFEDMTKVTPHEGTPLKLKKTLYTKVNTKRGPVLEPVKGALQVGDELVVRIELRTDRDMEYVHMKDQRGSGVEPVNVLSHYKYQDGLAYYESTRDTASHFFIDYLPKGIYVFEYSVRVQLRGDYQSGMAEIQCMYAPEFNSHSESFKLEVK